MTKINYSEYQKIIFSQIKEGKGNLVINALAGSGKTSTLIKSLESVDPKLKTLMTAFNSKIAAELKTKAPGHVEVFTLHQIGLRAVGKAMSGIVVDNNKLYSITTDYLKKTFPKLPIQAILGPLQQAVSLAKGFLLSSPDEIQGIIEQYNLDWGQDMDAVDFVRSTLAILKKCKENTKILDFDDMLWFTEVYKIPLTQYDRVFVDEAQDLNKVQRQMVLKMIKPGTARKPPGRCFVACDRFQSIYQFRGADEHSVENFIQDLDAKQLDLPISYRCPKSVIKEAQAYVPNIRAADDAIEGKVLEISLIDLFKTAQKGDFILSRYNRPLVDMALYFLKKSIPARIQGRDIGVSLSGIIKKCKGKTIKSVYEFIDKWEKSEEERLLGKDKALELSKDKAECLRLFAEGCNNVFEVLQAIDRMFVDKGSNEFIIFSSVHQAKGLESDRIFLFEDTFRQSSQQEKNIHYVAITRAKKELFYVNYYSERKDLP